MTWTSGCVFMNMTKLMQIDLSLRSYLGNRNNRLGNILRLVSHRLIKPALREDPLQVINEFDEYFDGL